MLLVATWTFLTNHARALLSVAHDLEARRRDIAASQGTSERSASGAPSPTWPKPATSWPFQPGTDARP